MDEQQIVAQVSQNIPKDIPVPSDAVSTPETIEVGDLHNNLPLQNMLLEQQLFDHFNVSKGGRQSVEVKQQLESVLNWAKENAPGAEITDIMNTIMHQENMMGIKFKEDRMFRLYKFARLNQQRLMVENQMKVLYA